MAYGNSQVEFIPEVLTSYGKIMQIAWNGMQPEINI